MVDIFNDIAYLSDKKHGKDRGSMHHRTVVHTGLILILGILVFLVPEAWSLDSALKLHPAVRIRMMARAHGPSSGFGQLDLRFSQPGDIEQLAAEYGVFLDGSYVTSSDQEYRATAGGSLEGSLYDDRLRPGAMYAYSLYRGDEDVNAHAATLWADWSPNDRTVLGVEQVFTREDYRKELTLNAGGAPTYRLGSIHEPALGSWGSAAGVSRNLTSLYDWVTTNLLTPDPGWFTITRSTTRPVTVKRDDRFASTTLRYTQAIDGGLRLDLSLARDHLDSTIDAAVYRRTSIGVGGSWQLAPRWELAPQARMSATHYKVKHPQNDDPDRTKILCLSLTRRQDAIAVSWRVEWLDNDSPFEEECYERTVVECIFACQF